MYISLTSINERKLMKPYIYFNNQINHDIVNHALIPPVNNNVILYVEIQCQRILNFHDLFMTKEMKTHIFIHSNNSEKKTLL